MKNPTKTPSYTLQHEEKVTPVMVYTHNSLIWGSLVSREMVRVSTWLRTPNAPPYLCLYDCQMLYTTGSTTPGGFRELHIPAQEVLAYHILPPQHDPPDYDPNEPNRMMVAVAVLSGHFRMDAHVRMSTLSSLPKFLEVMSEEFTSLYDVSISQPLRPNFKPLQVPFVLLRRETALFSGR
jgi:hypothetical protein